MVAILACVITFDLFLHPDRAITFDGRVHITTIAMYHDLLVKGEFPIVWVDSWGNYGHPLGLISYQTTSYFGGLLQIVLGSPVLAFNTLFLLATFLGGFLFYLWLTGHVRPPAAILGTLFFMLAPYRLQNIYVRGALPEYLAIGFFMLAVLGVQMALRGRRLGHLLVLCGITLTVLTNPMVLVVGTFFIVPYALLLCWSEKRTIKLLPSLLVSAILGLLVSGYYLLPLLLEIKYFHYGLGSKLRAGEFLSLTQLLSPFTPYFGDSHPGPPGVSLRLGMMEALGLGMGTLGLLTHKLKQQRLLMGVIVISVFLVVLILPISLPLFQQLKFLDGLQYPWRFLGAVGIVIPLLIALLFDLYGNMSLFLVAMVAILVARIPTGYGKNYIHTPRSVYEFTTTNLHTKNLAPLWAGESAEYILHPEKVGIIEGKAEISQLEISNSVRKFEINSDGARLIDYTFYFPGWKAYVDGQEAIIEFQDVNYRGVITYKVPEGKHGVELKFVPTATRKLGLAASAIGLFFGLAWIAILSSKH